MKKKETEFLTEEEIQAILRVPDRRTLQGQTGLRRYPHPSHHRIRKPRSAT